MKHRRHRLTLAYRLLLVFVLAFTTVWPLAGPPTSLGAAPPDAPPTPTPPVSPTPSPPEPGISSQSVTPPSPEDLPPEAEQARARQAMEAVLAKYLRYWGLRYQVASIEAAVEGEWAHGVAQWQSQAKTLNGPIHILARRQPDGVWQALLPGGDGLYLQWLEAVPEGLVPGGEKSQLRMQVAEAEGLRRPQATPAVPPAPSVMPLDKEGPGQPAEPAPGLAQPTATPTPQATLIVPAAITSTLPKKESDLTGETSISIITDQIRALYGPDCSPEGYGYNQDYTFFSDVLTLMSIPVSQFALDAFALWEPHENTSACWNPLATTYHVEWFPPGTGCTETLFNSAGVRNYSSKYCGELATARTLLYSGSGTYYKAIRDMLSQTSFDWQAIHTALNHWCNECYSGVLANQWQKLWNSGGGGGTTCPQSGGVILYWNANYNCDNTLGDAGYRQRTSTGWQNVNDGQFNDRASSVRIPSGWSVRLFADADRGGPSVCFNSDVSDFGTQGNFPGSSTPINDNVSSIEVFDNTNCSSGPQYPVTLYEHAGSGGRGLLFPQVDYGWWNLPDYNFNDIASSIEIDAGWSARLWLDDNLQPSNCYKCLTSSDSDFGGDHFDGGCGIGLNDQASSIEVFHNTGCSIPCTSPSAPSLSSPSNGAKLYPEDDLVFNWHGNASEYQVHWWGGPGGDHYSDWMGGTSWNVGQQWESPNRYYWSVKGRNGSGCEGDWSSTWEFMIGPRAPGNLNASAVSYSQINLSWQDNSSSESDYHIERSPNGSSWQQIATVSGTSYQDTGLNAGTTYYYRVRAHRHNDDTYSKYSNTASATTPSCPPPAAPTLVSPANGATLPHDADVTLDWNSSSGATDYYAHLWGGPSIDINSGWIGGTDWHIGQLWPGTYSWQVKARNQCGESGWSSGTFTVENPPIGPLGYDGHTVDDDNTDQSSGDGDGIVECGENIELYVILRNQGSGTATGVNATISTGDPYITWLYNTNSAYPDISGGGTGVNSNDFDFAVAPSTPDGHVIQFDLNVSASNAGPWSDSFSLPVACPQPDLRPYAPSGYPYPVVPSSIQGTHTVNTLYAGQPTYFDWHFINSGGGVAPGTFYVELWVDSTRYMRYPQPDFAPGQDGGLDDWAETITTPGWHTVRLITDPDNTVAESDETNNVWERQFYWTPTAPYADDMENGVNDWTAAGLWHQVDGNSPYPASHSGTHSWWYGQDSTGNYDPGAANSGDLTSPSTYIPTPGYYLRFWYRYETETQSPNWDQRWVQISVDGGPFNNVLQLYDDPMNWWLQSPAINLTGYAGHTIQVRFHFDTLDDGFNAYRGWYLDDFDISSTPPPSCADSYEPNNTPAQAVAMAYGQTRSADICPGGDYDFYQFTGAAGDRVVVDVDAKANGSSLDSYIFLLDSDGTNVLAENDDEIVVEVQDSHLGYQLPHNGTYYIKVRAWDHPSVGGTDYFYTIRLLRDNTNPSSAAITSPGNDAWLDPSLETITVSATDNQSGISHVAFLWHDADWENSDWVWLGEDWDGRDGWSWGFDTSGLTEQRGGAFYIWAFDWAGNWTSAGAWNLGIDRTPPTAGADVSLMYGDAPFLDFYVWWSGSDNLSGTASYDVQYRDGVGGTWANLLTGTIDTYTRFVGQNGHTYYFRTRARDYAGNLGTYASGGGDAQHTVQICAVAADAYESDNSHTIAKAIATNGTEQSHNFHAAGDRDWLKFTAGAGITYTLVTTNTGGHADTVLYLYESDGTTLITSNDDDPGRWPASRLEWGARWEGTYYVKVEHWDPYAYGCTTAYELSIAETGTFEVSGKVFLPIIFRNAP